MIFTIYYLIFLIESFTKIIQFINCPLSMVQIVHYIYSSLSASTGFVLTMFHAGMVMPMETVMSMMR